MSSVVILGTGLAGYSCAREFRKHDKSTPLVLITQDDGVNYSKPMLSTAFSSNKELEQLPMGDADKMAAQLDAKILTHTDVTKVDPQSQTIFFGDESLSYKDLVLACGADPLRLPIAGDADDAIFSINDLNHYQDFRKSLQGKKHVTIMGAGLIGCEFANDLSHAGFDVTVAAISKWPLDLLVPEEIGAPLKNALSAQGVTWHLEQPVVSVNKQADNSLLVELGNGETFKTDMVLSAVGLRANVDLAKQAGITVNKAIVVNEFLQTNIPHIFALGDCAEVCDKHLMYIAPIAQCARALGATLAGEKAPVNYPHMPVIVKTHCFPILVQFPETEVHDTKLDVDGNNMRYLYFDEAKNLIGFILTAEWRNQRMALLKNIGSPYEQ